METKEIKDKNSQIEYVDHKAQHAQAFYKTQKTKAANNAYALPEVVEKMHQIIDGLGKYEISCARLETASNDNYHDEQHKSVFKDYLRKGTDNELSRYEQKSLLTSSNNDGGYLVTNNMQTFITREIYNSSPMRLLSSCAKISTEALDIIEEIDAGDYAGWTKEIDPRDSSTTPRLNKRTIMTHEIYAQPKATQKLIDDANINIEEWLQEKLVEGFTTIENRAFINGDGNNMPRGILTYPHDNSSQAIERLEVEQNISSEDLLQLIFGLDDQYLNKAHFLMHRSTLQAIRMLKGPNGEAVWQPSMQIGVPDTIFGIAVIQSNDMPNYNNGGAIIALADFKQAYQIVDRSNVRILRDPFTEKPFVKFYATKRVGGDVKNFQAVKLLQLNK